MLCDADHGVEDSSECCSEIPSVCAECREPFAESQLEGGYPDRCDICGAFCHSNCLVDCANNRGEWSVCSKCQWATVEQSIPSKPALDSEAQVVIGLGSYESNGNLNQSHSSTSASLDSFPKDLQAHSPTHEDQGAGIPAAFQPLDDVLDFVVKFLEGEHAKSSCMSSDTRAMVLDMVKQTLAWKQMERTEDELHAKVSEINHVMSTVVAGLS